LPPLAKKISECIPAIVLAAGALGPSLSAIFGRTSSAMIPLNGRPAIHWLLTYLHETGVRQVVLGLRDSEVRLPKFVRQTLGQIQEILYEPIGEDRGPGFTLLKCMQRIPQDSPCLIVLGDTLFRFPARIAFDESFVLTAPVQDSSRWCLAQVDPANQVTQLADKPEKNPDSWPALIGVYYLRDGAAARAALQQLCDSGARSLQLRHALEPYIAAGKLRAFPAGEWFDCGNLDFLTSSRRRLLQARSFNTIQIDELRGTLTKRSQHRGKFLNEINYYRLLPRDLATFFPRLVDYSLTPDDVFLTLEYYGYTTLSEIWVFEEFEARYWEGILQQLARIIGCFQRYTSELSPAATFNFYWQKTVDRLGNFAGQRPEFARLVEAAQISLNQNALPGWSRICAEIEQRLRAIAAKPMGQIIHGDLCFPNILYDPVSRLFKLIDPRGSFAESGIYGDGRYDIAKLLHSLDGGYDFLIHDMFVIKQEEMNFTLQQFFPESRGALLQSFGKIFDVAFDLAEVRLLEGLLFLSMCPLHQGHPPRQAAMFVTGLRILNGVLNHENLH
jgi:dTDP-glucose pyrophosphorylase